MGVMLWLLNEHHVLPGVYYRMPEGEKTVVRELFRYTMEQRQG